MGAMTTPPRKRSSSWARSRCRETPFSERGLLYRRVSRPIPKGMTRVESVFEQRKVAGIMYEIQVENPLLRVDCQNDLQYENRNEQRRLLWPESKHVRKHPNMWCLNC